MKKTIYIFLSLLFVFTLLSCMAVFSSAATACGAVTSGSNVGKQDYVYNWARNIQSYLEVLSDGRLMRVQGSDNSEIGVEYYNSSFQLTKTLCVQEELPLFGGFYAYNGYYYILSGKSNHEENDSAEVYRLTKYDTNWNRLSSCSLYGANTYDPFDAGTARFASVGKYIFVHTCHTMYDNGDGLHHQANVMIQVDTGDMTVTDSYYIVMNSAYGYCSHSFNQFVTVDGGKLVSVNHGDAYPRSVVLMKYNNSDVTTGRFSGGNVSNYTMLGIKGEIGANYTGVKVGGFETSSTSYIVAGTTISQKETAEFAGSNVFVSVLNKSTGNVSLKYITAYNDESIKISAPQLVSIGSDSFVLMWNIDEKLYLCKLDAAGNLVGSIQSVNANLSDCKPIIYNGKIVWYTFVNSAVTFYSISTSNLASLSVSKTDNDHVWKKVSTDSEGVSTFKCENCSKTMQGKIPTSMTVWWVESSSGNSTYYTSYINTSVDSNTSSPKYRVDFSGGDTALNVLSVKSSDPSVARVNENGYIDFLKGGTATVTFSCLYDSSLSNSYTFKVKEALSASNITVYASSVEYNGKVRTPAIIVKNSAGVKLTEGTDYTVTVPSGRQYPGTYVYKITGIGNYTGTVNKNFVIKPYTVKASDITLYSQTVEYNGNVRTPSVTVKTPWGATLTEGTHYTVTIPSGRQYPGTYTYKLTFKGRFTGTVSKNFVIKPYTVKASDITLYSQTVEYNGKVRTPQITVKTPWGATLTEGTHYTVSIPEGRQYPGTYKYIFAFKGRFAGTVNKDFVIKNYTVKASDITLYSETVAYNGKERTPKITVTTSWGATLYEGTHYSVVIPEGRKTPGTYTYKFTFKGRFAGTVNKNFVIKPYTVKASDITLYSETVTYNGKVRTPSITVKTPWGATLTEETHYSVVVPAGRKDPGTYTYTFTFKGRFTGTVNKTFTILPK